MTPMLTTDRFDLHRPHADDLPGLCTLIADEETRRYLGPASPERPAQFERLLRNAGSWALYGYGTFIVRPRGERDLVASCGVFHSWRGYGPELGLDDAPEAGWIVRRDWQGRGLAREVMEAVLGWFDREHGPRRIACMIEAGNTPSERLAAALGFAPYAQHEISDASGTATLGLFERPPATG